MLRSTRRRYLRFVLVLVPVLLAGLVVGAPAALASIDTSATPLAIADAMASNSSQVTGASFQTEPPSGTPNAVSTTALTSFPTNGSSYAILTSGDATLADQATDPNPDGADDGGATPTGRGDTAFDVSVLKVDLAVPTGDNCLSFNFQFLSQEYPTYVGTQYNDAFIAELDNSTWTTSGSTISAPNNFAFDSKGNVISINAAGAETMTAGAASGTTYGGATPPLSASTPITSGAHSLYLSIFDQGDHILDSAAFIDNVVLGTTAPGGCISGATTLTTSKTADSSTAAAGTPDGYTISVANSAASASSLSTISDVLPAGFSYVTGSTSGATTSDPSTNGQTLTWSGPFSVPAGHAVSLHFGVTVASTPGNYFNNASGTSDTSSVTPTGPTAEVTVTGGGGPGYDVSITKTGTPNPVSAGGKVSFVSTVSNSGPDNAPSVTFTDNLPSGTTLSSVRPTSLKCKTSGSVLTCPLGTLQPGSTSINVILKMPASVPSGGIDVTNTASAVANPPDSLPGNDNASATVHVKPPSQAFTGTYVPPGGGTVSSPPLGGNVKQQAIVTVPPGTNGGAVTIQIPSPDYQNGCVPGVVCYGKSFGIESAAVGTPSSPLLLQFKFAKGVIPADESLSEIFMLRNGVQVPLCAEQGVPQANPDPCQYKITRNAKGVVTIFIASSNESDPRYRGGG